MLFLSSNNESNRLFLIDLTVQNCA